MERRKCCFCSPSTLALAYLIRTISRSQTEKCYDSSSKLIISGFIQFEGNFAQRNNNNNKKKNSDIIKQHPPERIPEGYQSEDPQINGNGPMQEDEKLHSRHVLTFQENHLDFGRCCEYLAPVSLLYVIVGYFFYP